MAAVRCKRNSEGRTLSSRQAHESQVKIARFHIQYLNVHSSKYEIVLNIKGTQTCPPFSLFRANGSPAAVGGRPAYFYLGKTCSGGNSRDKPIAWLGGWRGGWAGFPALLKPAGRPQLPMDITYNH